MNMGFRTFILEETGGITHVPLQKFNQLLNRKACFSEYAGKCMRYAMICVENQNHKPVAIIRSDYGFIRFDKHGLMDEGSMMEKMRLAAETFELSMREENIIDIRPDLAKERYAREFKWIPTVFEQETLEKAVFKRQGKRLILRIRRKRK